MPDRHAVPSIGRIAVVDVGSNSLRLVVFERLGASLLPLLNEKVMCALGRGIARTGRLNPDGVELAFANLQRFVALARALKVDHLAIIATAAVREASDGEDFAAEAERQCGVPVRIIAGSEEARLSAAGVLAGVREADGVVGDLGGGSVELVRVDSAASAPIGAGVSLPLGPLRLAELDDNRKAVAETIERGIAGAPVLHEAAGKTLYLVGGAWRAIARLHMEQTHYPLHIIHEYTIARRAAEGFLEMRAGQSRRSLERIASNLSRGGYDGDHLLRWTAPIFRDLDEDSRRLHRAACWLSDFAWTEHPDYRAEQAFTRALRMPVAQIAHHERVFIASALHARYGGASDDPIKIATRPLLADGAAIEARRLGLALRLAYTLCGGALELLEQVRVAREAHGIVLELPPTGSLFTGEAVQRRLDALGRAFGLETRTVRRRSPSPALA